MEEAADSAGFVEETMEIGVVGEMAKETTMVDQKVIITIRIRSLQMKSSFWEANLLKNASSIIYLPNILNAAALQPNLMTYRKLEKFLTQTSSRMYLKPLSI